MNASSRLRLFALTNSNLCERSDVGQESSIDATPDFDGPVGWTIESDRGGRRLAVENRKGLESLAQFGCRSIAKEPHMTLSSLAQTDHFIDRCVCGTFRSLDQ